MAHIVARIVADRLHRDVAKIAEIDADIESAGLYGSTYTERAALLILAALAGADGGTNEETAEAILGLVAVNGGRAVPFLAECLDALGRLDNDRDHATTAFRSSVSAVLGDDLAIVVRVDTDDGPEELAFSEWWGRFTPFREEAVSISLTVSGRTLFKIALDIAELTHPLAVA